MSDSKLRPLNKYTPICAYNEDGVPEALMAQNNGNGEYLKIRDVEVLALAVKKIYEEHLEYNLINAWEDHQLEVWGDLIRSDSMDDTYPIIQQFLEDFTPPQKGENDE